jgi:hypothetical protein
LLSTHSLAPRRSSRLAGAAGALLLQGGFAFLFLYSMPRLKPPLELGRELTLALPRLTQARPSPTAPSVRLRTGLPAPIIQNVPEVAAPAAPAPTISDLSNFGQALNGCALEKYNSLTPEQRARCPRPGAGVAIQEAPNLSGTRPEAKDEALWQEHWDEAHWMPGLCGPDEGPVVLCQMHQAIAESERAEDVRWHLARDKAAALQPPTQLLPKAIGIHPQ